MASTSDRPDDTTTRRVERTARRGTTRREVLRSSAGALGVAVVGSTTVAAHESHQTTGSDGESTGTDEEGDTVFSTAVIRSSAPKLGYDDYIGLFIQIVGTAAEPDESGVGNCPAFDGDQSIATLRGQFLDLRNEDQRGEEGILFIDASNPDIQPGKLFVVNDQRSCEGEHFQLQLEQVGASKVDVPEGTTTDSSFTRTPGFGPLAALSGLALGAAGALRALRRE